MLTHTIAYKVDIVNLYLSKQKDTCFGRVSFCSFIIETSYSLDINASRNILSYVSF